ncbi:molybdenum cofactor sulfurase-like [Papaver somniferum]|uniref:molybdenum cofactor sulfurase-like n=1 Tax=Papaver somniferum TaxID=3469 RepID=UPI000E6FA539|nr:molybdenum cofactor sulfurase-like [Papaver somniferum]XP_026384739.1 molybdenum cofactor sulfurase-like [Papaver somniferum]XP_026384746.1 molybdenum cofactor sulfurase-like [Papaver somniferum]
MEMILKDFTTNVYGNPHSQSDTSSSTSDLVRSARQQVLEYFNASPKDYKCIFTSGATAALKLVGEAFPWTKESCFVYTMENHNSVLGIREYALSKGAAALAVDVEEIENQNGHPRNDLSSLKLSQRSAQRRSRTEILEDIPTANSLGSAYNLFAFPSECNFSGMKFSLDLVKLMKENSERALEGSPYSSGQWMVFD